MVLYDGTALAGQAVLPTLSYAADGRASVFIAGLTLQSEEGAVLGSDLQLELDALFRTGRRVDVNVSAAIVTAPSVPKVPERADSEGVTHVICMHPPWVIWLVFGERDPLLTLRS